MTAKPAELNSPVRTCATPYPTVAATTMAIS